MIRVWIPGGIRLEQCPSCRRGDRLEIQSRAYYEAYEKWQDGGLAGRCGVCGYELRTIAGLNRMYETALEILQGRWQQCLTDRVEPGFRAHSAGDETT